MKTTVRWILAGFGILGFLCGFVAKRVAASSGGVRTPPAARPSPGNPPGKHPPAPASGAELVFTARNLRSADTLDDLVRLGAAASLNRLALWLLDAPPGEITAYWEALAGSPNPPDELLRLVMLVWTMDDPHGAVAAAEARGCEGAAYWAWAAHAPRAALDAALAKQAPRIIAAVAGGIGEFHPQWLRRNLEKLPRWARPEALQALGKHGGSEDPRAILEFMLRNGATRGIAGDLLACFVARDPVAACDWYFQNRKQLERIGASEAFFLRTLGAAHPKALAELADRTPSGWRKREMEAILYEQLLSDDPEEAIRQARATQAVNTAAERMAAAARRLLPEDPDRAFSLAADLLLENPNSLWFPQEGSPGAVAKRKSARVLLSAMLDADPVRTADLLCQPTRYKPRLMGQAPGNAVIEMWAERDLDGLMNWFESRAPASARDSAAAKIFRALGSQRSFEDAARWLPRLSDPASFASQLVVSWSRADPERARQWLETSTLLPEETKNRLLESFFSEP